MYYPPDRFYEKTDYHFDRLFMLAEQQIRLLQLLTNEIVSLNREIVSLNREIRKAKFKKSKFKK